MAKIEIRTTVDITNTNVRRPDQGTDKQLNQERNFTTFQQVLGLRSVFYMIQKPVFEDGHWTFVIEPDREGVYDLNNDPVGLLKEDLENVPIITGLDETKANKNKIIKVSKPGANTFVQVVDK